MASKKKHFSGGLFRGKHTTTIDGTEKVIDAVRKMRGITMSLGYIDFKRGGRGSGNIRVKLVADASGLVMRILRGSKSQTILLFGKNISLEEVKYAIESDKACAHSGISVEICSSIS